MKAKTPALVLGFLAVVGVGYGGWRAFGEYQLRNLTMDPIKPGHVNIVAVNPGSGFGIIVSNQVAQLAEFSDSDLDSPEMNEDDVITKKKLLIREFLGALQGNGDSLGKLVMSLNDVNEGEFPAQAEIWTKDQIERALKGDANLKPKLERALSMTLDGQPLPTLDLDRLIDGIIIEIPFQMEYNVGGTVTKVDAIYRESFNSQFATRAGRRLTEKFLTDAAMQATYNEEIKRTRGELTDKDGNPLPAQKENLATSLASRFSETRLKELTAKPYRVLENAFVVVNDEMITGASKSTYEGNNNQLVTDIRLNLTEEGRLRLWKFSREHPRFQLLFMVNSVALAAPRIGTELAEKSVTIRGVGAEQLAADAVDDINRLTSTRTTQPSESK
ncbi:hypothetical protein CCB81_02015 [Armatimonadetes bacterium Uphvl-Ar2]|nr:hypothetical protein CCB81_02015 [Armatimonadetes bacterium Uphvl-Ar2]